jgi:MFS family permease
MAEKEFITAVDASQVESSGTDSPDGSRHMNTDDYNQFHDVGNVHGFSADLESLPKGYYYSPFFLGSMAGVFFGLMAGVRGFAVAAPILGLINKDIGPDPNYFWVALIYSLTLAVGFTFVGRLSDIFRRRWFFIGGALVALIGAVVCATAKSIPVLIGGETLIVLGGFTQLSFPFAMGELIPMKHRFLGNAILYISCLPMSGFGPALANAVVLHTPTGWRTGYYLLIAVDGISLTSYVLFYQPPTFHEKHASANLFHWIKHFD